MAGGIGLIMINKLSSGRSPGWLDAADSRRVGILGTSGSI